MKSIIAIVLKLLVAFDLLQLNDCLEVCNQQCDAVDCCIANCGNIVATNWQQHVACLINCECAPMDCNCKCQHMMTWHGSGKFYQSCIDCCNSNAKIDSKWIYDASACAAQRCGNYCTGASSTITIPSTSRTSTASPATVSPSTIVAGSGTCSLMGMVNHQSPPGTMNFNGAIMAGQSVQVTCTKAIVGSGWPGQLLLYAASNNWLFSTACPATGCTTGALTLYCEPNTLKFFFTADPVSANPGRSVQLDHYVC